MSDRNFETRQIHSGQGPDEHGALNTPIYANVTYAYDSPTETRGEYRYSRMADPTGDSLNDVVADLENGTHARTFASGMGAINALFATVLSAGDHVVASENLYAETHTLLTRVFSSFDVEVSLVDTTDPEVVADAIRPETELVYLETPTNPILRVSDIEAVADRATEQLVAVDNTFASPALQRPLDLGADVVVESLTKYISGHSDAIAGALVTDDAELDSAFGVLQYNQGATLGPFEAFLVRRGAKTLAGRMRTHCENARLVAEHLAEHPDVSTVHYPGLESHPDHDVAARQMADFGGMVSFELDGSLSETSATLSAMELFELAESLGGVESLVEQPAVMTHQDLSREERHAAGITDSLVRLSVGIEHPDDLIADLDAAIEAGLSERRSDG